MRKALAVCTILILLAAGCVGEERLETTTFVIEQDGEETVEAELVLSKGRLALTGGSSGVFEGEFIHQLSDYTPHYEYKVEEGRGHLVVEQPSVAQAVEDGSEYKSTVWLSREIPYELVLTKTAGFSEIDFSEIMLLSLEADLGDSHSVLDFRGEYPRLARVSIDSGSGEDDLAFDGVYPALTELVMELEAINDIVSLNGGFNALMILDLQMGGGNDDIGLGGSFARLTEVTINTSAGDDVIVVNGTFEMAETMTIQTGRGMDDVFLTGTWPDEATITITSRQDRVRIIVPDNSGLRIEVGSPSIVVSGDSLTTEETVITNQQFGTASRTLNLRFNTSDGEVTSIFEILTESQVSE